MELKKAFANSFVIYMDNQTENLKPKKSLKLNRDNAALKQTSVFENGYKLIQNIKPIS